MVFGMRPKAISAIASAAVLSAIFINGPVSLHAETRTPQTRGPDCTITGTPEAEVLEGTDKADVICGMGGADTITGGGGPDIIFGGGGDDVINAGAGSDTVRGNLGNDSLLGRQGDDYLYGGSGEDMCRQNQGVGKEKSCEWPNPLLTCPVATGTVYNDFGDSRGDHTHEGNDITAKKGEPVLATFRGKTENLRASGAGLYVKLTASDGSFTYGMHLSKFKKEGRVRTGDVIGFVGSSGNAGNINHLHFEWHPDGGSAVDPYPYLSRVCKSTSK